MLGALIFFPVWAIDLVLNRVTHVAHPFSSSGCLLFLNNPAEFCFA